jgi:hypothetical protein
VLLWRCGSGLGSEVVVERGAASSGVEVLGARGSETPGLGTAQASAVGVGIDSVILAMSPAGAMTAAVEALRLWSARDRGRRVQLSLTVQGGAT